MRKGKLIATYELKVVLGWEGSARGAGGAPVGGKITLPYVSEVSSCVRAVSLFLSITSLWARVWIGFMLRSVSKHWPASGSGAGGAGWYQQ